ncbi:hypothetical protein SAMN05720766_10984 [Fibrobacter sp. UWH9]|uniref:hypothetical protein n=1 Tax=Fibrobacter sp. UWH9 TaxID=1896213 RepID=UPI0009127073|nr:hypothetical protein [Fibrobacter sp. UWH9]SHH26103.1 hypothetical protein SAMN05720766_10984 [Fibrobacter sp. UWH9]
MTNAVIRLKGKTHNETNYVISIFIDGEGKISHTEVCGKPCRAVKETIDNLGAIKSSNVNGICDAIRLKMATHNEYVKG